MTALRKSFVDLLPPLMIAVVLLFWAYGPKAVLDSPWTLMITAPSITVTVLLLELVFERHPGWRINLQEFFTDLFYVVLSATVITWTTEALAETPLRALKASLGFKTEWVLAMPWLAQVAFAIFILEFGQYWMHRLMHNVTPFWLTHAPHHHLTQLNAAKGAVGNPIELFLISLSVLALFDFDKTALFAAFNTMGVISTFAHANVRSNPPIWYSFFFTTIRHHSLHHSTDYEATRCNYGNSLILLDRIFGTYREGEASVVGQDERKRLSILEQTLFPFQPLIDRAKARRTTRADVDAPTRAVGA
ncbi:sterol desaturase/sphingolipid hydroxylase (fatty acid hydroxylase superfamily) [Novosphingobium chloroacetimidivorans]|uniref:Sterol desaturase/sphingolipid hydroxylase (Fatty acid hydroxylase superfamily) n=1 Tax=Novosphingobium chloroacetimidivorans TaxID=1428314 RepID=A0A7W7NXA7_9SPHN|nr:sterol desaturase family protein [Novosphingobium chloroacetimidivorans]MBB4858937.1 sterol desaturase/sphingolipid hydroxylase (fatty acid hydroxylase superfamily) [Novosphingobium chloroacetimidivorans]